MHCSLFLPSSSSPPSIVWALDTQPQENSNILTYTSSLPLHFRIIHMKQRHFLAIFQIMNTRLYLHPNTTLNFSLHLHYSLGTFLSWEIVSPTISRDFYRSLSLSSNLITRRLRYSLSFDYCLTITPSLLPLPLLAPSFNHPLTHFTFTHVRRFTTTPPSSTHATMAVSQWQHTATTAIPVPNSSHGRPYSDNTPEIPMFHLKSLARGAQLPNMEVKDSWSKCMR